MMWGRKTKITLAKVAATKSGLNAYIGRKLKKRDNRGLQQTRINAAARELGVSFSKLIGSLKAKKIGLDRKVLSEIAMKHPAVFEKIVKA